MNDPELFKINSYIHGKNDIAKSIETDLWDRIENSHNQSKYKDLPGKNPWGKRFRPVYKKLLPSEMEAMGSDEDTYAGDCSSISHISLSLCRLNGISADNVFVLRTKEHSVTLVQHDGDVFFYDNTAIEEFNEINILLLNVFRVTGFYNDKYYVKKRLWLTRRKFEGEGTLKDKIEREFNVRFTSMDKNYSDTELKYYTDIALQKRTIDTDIIINTVDTHPLVKQFHKELVSLDNLLAWMNGNIGTKSIFPYKAFMTPDQIIVFQTGTSFDKSIMAVTFCRLSQIDYCLYYSPELTEYAVKAEGKAYIFGEDNYILDSFEPNEWITVCNSKNDI